ncbi:MAG: sulfatase [bacterium]|nr:MAG: sulfatase [bacterium]KAF0149809.1 MAG: sulfatase [bacterium]KAF0168510.1 MAG: sulfatase [bacterium]TXT19557.1 MAG: sulfatase [bacterium]
MSTLTILICTHNRAALLERVLASLNAARRPESWRVDILVAANACTDGTEALLTSYEREQARRDGLPLTWFAEPVPGKSHALNQAMPRVSADVVAFVDDDHRVDAGFLTTICQAAEAHPATDLFCGRILPDWDGGEPAWVHDQGPYRIYPLPVPRYDLGAEPREIHDEGPLPGGGNLFLRVPWLARVGDFSTEFGPKGHDLGGAEDLEWVRRALALGARLRYAPEVLQYHYVDTQRLRLGYLVRKAFERSASSVRLRHSVEKVPLFTYRKLAGYLLRGLFSLHWPRTRFFLVRFAAALGEIKGYRQVAREQAARVHSR